MIENHNRKLFAFPMIFILPPKLLSVWALFWILFFFLLEIPAQINVFTAETMRQLNKETGFYNKARIDFTYHSGNTVTQAFKLRYRTDYVRSNYHLFAVNDFQVRSKDSNVFINQGMIHGRSIRSIKPKQMLEAFVQKQFNQSILLKDRSLLGGGLRFQLFDQSPNKTNSNLGVYVGVGAMWEYEKIEDVGSVALATNLIRSTNYISLNYAISGQSMLEITTYYQVNFTDQKDFRVLTEVNLNYQLTKKVQTFTSLNSRYDNEPPQKLFVHDLQINNGIILSF